MFYAMAAPKPNPPWHQFSLRSLLLLTAFVAVLCSIGAWTHWLVSATIAVAVVVGGVTGRIVAGTRLGFVEGALGAIPFFVVAFVVPLLLGIPFSPKWEAWYLKEMLVLAALFGGIVGGFSVRPRSGR